MHYVTWRESFEGKATFKAIFSKVSTVTSKSATPLCNYKSLFEIFKLNRWNEEMVSSYLY